jgi:hypothetical protein
MRTHIYLTEGQYRAMKGYAKDHGITVSRVVRQAINGAFGLADDTRGFLADGKHTKQAKEYATIAEILRKAGR